MKYKDIIYLDRPKSRRERMSISDRSAQFAPFSALTGHQDAIDETARIVDEKLVLSEDRIEELSHKFSEILMKINENPEVKVVHFIKDELKSGGRYETVQNRIRKYDVYKRILTLENNVNISIDDILEIDEVVSLDK